MFTDRDVFPVSLSGGADENPWKNKSGLRSALSRAF